MAKKANASKRASLENKNNKTLQEALDGKVTIIGRVEKALGNCAFQVALAEGKIIQGLIRGVFKGGRNSDNYVAPGMFVFLAPSNGRSLNHEILGVINRKKDIKTLKEMKVIHASLCDNSCADDLFDYQDGEEEESREDAGPSHGASRLIKKNGIVKEHVEALIPEPEETKKKTRPLSTLPVQKQTTVIPTPSESVSGIWGNGLEKTSEFRVDNLKHQTTPDNWEDEIDIDAI